MCASRLRGRCHRTPPSAEYPALLPGTTVRHDQVATRLATTAVAMLLTRRVAGLILGGAVVDEDQTAGTREHHAAITVTHKLLHPLEYSRTRFKLVTDNNAAAS